MFAKADAARIPLSDQSVDLVFGSPPYVDARLYLEDGVNLGISRDVFAWVEWMLRVTTEALRVSRGPVLWVAAGVTRDRTYQPAVEGLMWEWRKRGGSIYRPCYWHRVGIPGSGGDQWFRSDVEYVACFKRNGKLPWSNNRAMGHAPKYAPGGEMSHRLSDGTRKNQWGGSAKSGGNRRANGDVDPLGRPSHRMETMKRNGDTPEHQNYVPPAIANPGNLVKISVGGGLLGDELAHENEAPFPEALADHFIRSLCPEGGTTLDPFSGSGTTVAAATKAGRSGIGLDLRQSQCALGSKRIKNVSAPLFA